MKPSYILISFLVLLCLASCREEDKIIIPTYTQVTDPIHRPLHTKGFFLLNEGNNGSNKASIDYFDYTTGRYQKNIYPQRNPEVIKELGDVGNDLQIYNDRLYAVINCSNLIEVMDVHTARHIGEITIPNCRYIAFKDNYAYVSSYAGPVQIDPNARLGYIAKIDLTTLQVIQECTVGFQPEEIAIIDNKLYVANSGGYRVPNYDNTISVIDLTTFTEIKKIEVGINMHRLEVDQYGDLYASSRGNYRDIPSRTYSIDTQTDQVKKIFELPNSEMAIAGDSLYICSTEFNYNTQQNTISYAIIDTYKEEIVTRNFITDGTEVNIAVPYGIAINKETKELYITDAKEYVNPGQLFCYSIEGKLKWSVTTGDIPAHFAFTTHNLH